MLLTARRPRVAYRARRLQRGSRLHVSLLSRQAWSADMFHKIYLWSLPGLVCSTSPSSREAVSPPWDPWSGLQRVPSLNPCRGIPLNPCLSR